ncbi:MAG: YggS family pyridoxal phosphate-dependent enzyme [Acidimicrobiia bacterium]
MITTPDAMRARVAELRERIAAAALESGRDASEITIVAAAKTVDASRTRLAIDAGIRCIGENRAQELLEKAPQLMDCDPEWHFIGALQRNKVRGLAPWVALWHSVDRLALAEAIAQRAPGAAVLIEVNTSGEASKAGVPLPQVGTLVDQVAALGLEVRGLMTVPAPHRDPTPAFAALRQEADYLGLAVCSMGMSDDFECAIREGATVIRLGRVLFGDRPAPRGPAVPD